MENNLTEDFLYELFKKCLKSNETIDVVVKYMKYQYLPTEPFKKFWKFVSNYYRTNSKIPSYGIISQTFQDEDSANLLINRYNYRKCLPLVDIEEIPYVDMEIFHNYKYGAHPVSNELILPQHENDLIAFHGFKNPEFQNHLKENYFKTVLS